MNNNGYFGILDIINIMSYVIQMQNLEDDKKYKGTVTQFENMVQKEVENLHKENEIIMQKLDDIMQIISD